MPGLMKTSRWACILVLVIGVFVLHREVLVGGMVYHNEDAADGYYPSHVAILRALGHGGAADLGARLVGRLAAGRRSVLRALLPTELSVCRRSARCEGSA